MRSDRISEHEDLGWLLVHALQDLSAEHAAIFERVTTSPQFQAILVNDPKDPYWSSFSSPLDQRCPIPFESRFRDLANDLCGMDEMAVVPEVDNLVESVLNSWWALIDDGIYRAQDNEFYRFQSRALQEALSRGQAWFGSLSALRGLLASPCHAAGALRQQNIDIEKLGKPCKVWKTSGAIRILR